MNKAVLTGYIQDDALVIRTTGTGDEVLNFTIRVKRNKETSDFIDCTAWKSTANFISKYFKKGDPIGIFGRISTSVYEKNGEKRKKLYVEVSEAEFCLTQKPAGETLAAEEPKFAAADDDLDWC